MCHLRIGNTVLPLIPYNALILTLSLLRRSVVALIKRPFVLFSARVASILCDLWMFALCGYQSKGPAAAMNVRIITRVLSSGRVNCLYAGLGENKTDVAGSNHVMN